MTPAEARLLRASAKGLGVALEQDALDRPSLDPLLAQCCGAEILAIEYLIDESE